MWIALGAVLVRAHGRTGWPPLEPLDTLRYVASYATLGALLGWLVVRAPRLARASGLDRSDGVLAVGLAALHLVSVRALVSVGVGHSNFHDYGKLAAIVAKSPFSDAPLDVHGTAPYALHRVVGALAGGDFGGPFLVTGVLASASVALLYAWVRLDSGRRDVATAAASVLALAPWHQRMAGSLDLLLVVAFFLLGGLVLLEIHRRDRARGTLLAAAACVGIAATSHLEMLLFAPLVAAAHLGLRDPAVFTAAVREPRAWLVLLAVVVPQAIAPAIEWAAGDMGGGAGALRLLVEPSPAWVLLVAAALYLVRTRGRAPAALPAPGPGLRSALAAAVLLIPLAGLAWQPFDGFDQPPPAPALATLHVVFDPNYAPLLPAVLAVIGALGLARCDRTTFARLVLPTLLLALFYDRAHDSTSSYLRLAAVPGVLLAALAGRGAVAVATTLGRPRWILGGLAALLALTWWPHRAFLGWRSPQQTEQPLLYEAAELVRSGKRLATLSAEDVRPEHAGRFHAGTRLYAAHFVNVTGRHLVATAGDLLADPSRVEEGDWYWYQGAACYWLPARYAPDLSVTDALVGDKVVRFDPPVVAVADDVWRGRQATTRPLVDVDRLVPCWHRPEEATCAAADPAGCVSWRFPEACEPRPWEDPTCTRIRETFTLEPVAEAELAMGGDSLPDTAVVRPRAIVGLYRLHPR